MSLFSLLGAIEIGLIFALVALGVYISFRLLRFPDLTVDGSFPLGGAVCAVMIVAGFNPWIATLGATLAGAAAGLVTGWLNVKLKIMDLLASILMMTALYSINLRVMNGPNVPLIAEPTLFTQLQPDSMADYVLRPLVLLVIVVLAKLLLDWFFATERGLAIRATGSNARMARAQGINTGAMVLLGMAISNALVGLAGALFVQTQGGAHYLGHAGGGAGGHRVPLLYRCSAQQRLYWPEGARPEPDHRRAGHAGAGAAPAQAQTQRPRLVTRTTKEVLC